MIVGEAADGTEAVQLVGKDQPDLVLMDIHMPVMDGLKATQKIKASCPDVKVVLYSVYPGYQEEATQAGADYFMIKGSPDTPLSETILSFFPRKISSNPELFCGPYQFEADISCHFLFRFNICSMKFNVPRSTKQFVLIILESISTC